MRILFIHYGTIDGGDSCGFTRSYTLSASLARYDNEVIFLTTQRKGFKFPYQKEIRNNVTIFAFPEVFPQSFRKGGFAPLSTLLKIFFVLFKKADIVHSDTGHRPNSGLPCLIHRFFYKSKYFSEWWEHFGKGGIYNDMPRWHQLTIGKFDNYFETRNKIKADGCIPISEKLKQRAIKIGIPEEKILVLNGGADILNIKFSSNSRKNRTSFNLDFNSIIVGIIGINDEEISNHINLLEAIKNLNKAGGNYLLLGTGKISDRIKNEYESDGFLQVFEWLPYHTFCSLIECVDIFALIQKSNTRNESRFPNKLGDYLAASRPIITNGVGEVKYYSKKYPEAFFFTDNSVDDIEKSLINISTQLNNGTINYKNIRKIAIQNSWDERAKSLIKFYSK